MSDEAIKQANRMALLNALRGGATAAASNAAKASVRPQITSALTQAMTNTGKSLSERSGLSQFARNEVVRPFRLGAGQAAAGDRYLQGLGTATPALRQQAAAKLLNLTDRSARLGGDTLATAGNFLGKSLPEVNKGVGQFVRTLPNLLNNPINRLPGFNKLTELLQSLKGRLPKAIRWALPGTTTGALSAGVLGHSLASTGKQVGEIYNDSVQPMIDKAKLLTEAPDASVKLQNAYEASGKAIKGVNNALAGPAVTSLLEGMANLPAVNAAKQKATRVAGNIGTNALTGLANDLSYNVGTGLFRNTPIKLMANASPAMAAAHSAFNYFNPGAQRLSTEELKKRLASRTLGSIKDEFTGMLPWSNK
jgi:hypothetical protein